MKFLRGILGKKEAEKAAARELSEGEIEELLGQRIEGKTEQICKKAEPLVEQFPDVSSKVESSLKALEDAQIDPQVAGATHLILNARKHYIFAIRKSLGGVEPGSCKGYAGIKLRNKQLSDALVTIRNADVNHAKMIRFLFGKELSAVRQELNGVIRISKELDKVLKNDSKGVGEVEDLLSKMDELHGARERLEKSRGEQGRLEDAIEGLKEREKALAAELQRLGNSAEIGEVAELRQNIAAKKARLAEIEGSISNYLSPLGRALKKYKRLVEIDAGKAKIVQTAESNPIALLDEDVSIDELAKSLQESVEKNQIAKDEKERQKTLQKIDNLISAKPDELKKEYSKSKKELAGLEQELASSGVLKEKGKLQAEKSKLGGELEDAQERLEKTKEGISEVKGEADRLKSQIREGMERIEKGEVRIRWT